MKFLDSLGTSLTEKSQEIELPLLWNQTLSKFENFSTNYWLDDLHANPSYTMHLIEQPNRIQEMKMEDYFRSGDHSKSNYERLEK